MPGTGETTERGGTGKHRGGAARLVPPGGGVGGAGGAYVVDTPGLREVGAWGVDPELLAPCFPEFRRFLDQCRFDNCRHLAEPDCGVRTAAERGAFDPDRLVSFRHIYDEGSGPSWADRKSGGEGKSV